MPKDWREAWDLVSHAPLWALAFIWRTLLFRTTFVAITGSFGKTTTKDCLAAILSSVAPTVATTGNNNGRRGITQTILRTRPWHRFAVIETGTGRRGGIYRASLLLRPDVAVIVCVGRTHSDAFPTLEDVAAEKSQLLRFLRPNGTAVLNADDARVSGMRERFRGNIVTFGESSGCDVLLESKSAIWPDHLRMTMSAGNESESIQTQLVGSHWANAVLAATAAARVCGLSLQQARRALSKIESCQGRMHPERLPNGAILLRDDYNGSVESFERAVDVLRTAKADRRILVMADCSDFRKRDRQRQIYFGRVACEVAEMAVFVGDHSTYAVRAAIEEGMDPSCVHASFSLEDAAEWLRGHVRNGDLVLLRGRTDEHVARIYFLLLGTVDCRKTACRKRCLCDDCEELGFRATAIKPGVATCD